MSELYAWLLPNGEILEANGSHGETILQNPEKFGVSKEKMLEIMTEGQNYASKAVYQIAFEFGAVRLSISNKHMNIEGIKDFISRYYERLLMLMRNFSIVKIFIGYFPDETYDDLTPKEFAIKMGASNNWYKESMALDPNAYKNETQPTRLQQDSNYEDVWMPSTGKFARLPKIDLPPQEHIDKMYSGVHFAFTPEHAAIYAIGKATKDDPPVIIEIEPKGLKQQPDIDATIDQSLLDYIQNQSQEWQTILQSGKDVDTIAEELHFTIEGDAENWTVEGEVTDTADDIIIQQQIPIPPTVIIGLIKGKPSQRVVKTIQSLMNGNIPPKLKIQMVGQMRVNNQIDSSRVKAIYQVPWIDLSAEVTQDFRGMDEERLQEELDERGWHQEGDDIINEEGKIVPSYEELVYDQWLSKTPLYVNKQTYFKGYTSNESVWHGTTISRARSAYPDLLGGTTASRQVKEIESWYKPPFMRAMNYVGAQNNKGNRPPIWYINSVTTYGAHFVVFKIQENYWAYQLSFPDWVKNVRFLASKSPGKALAYAKKKKSHAYQVTRDFPMPNSIIREEGESENNEYIEE